MRPRLFRNVIITSLIAAGFLWASSAPVYADTITLTPENTVVLRGEVNNSSVTSVTSAIMLSKSDHVYLYIDSPGGSIFAGLRLVDFLGITNKRVTCVAHTAISMAFVIFQSCNERLITERGLLMQHVASYGFDGQEPNNHSWAVFFHGVMQDLYKRQAAKIGMTTEAFAAKIRDDWWMWDQEAIDNGAADGKVDVKCSDELMKKYDTVSIQVFIFQVKLKFSSCPLVPGPIQEESPDEAKKKMDFEQELNRIKGSFDARAIADKIRTRK